MPRKKINHQRVRTARLHGLPSAIIAKRLGCSARQVRRICKDLTHSNDQLFIDTELEWTLWANYKKMYNYSIRRIAFCFCLSHEHIRQVLIEKQTKKEAA